MFRNRDEVAGVIQCRRADRDQAHNCSRFDAFRGLVIILHCERPPFCDVFVRNDCASPLLRSNTGLPVAGASDFLILSSKYRVSGAKWRRQCMAAQLGHPQSEA